MHPCHNRVILDDSPFTTSFITVSQYMFTYFSMRFRFSEYSISIPSIHVFMYHVFTIVNGFRVKRCHEWNMSNQHFSKFIILYVWITAWKHNCTNLRYMVTCYTSLFVIITLISVLFDSEVYIIQWSIVTYIIFEVL